MEFIESAPFTRKLHCCAGENADAVLRAIQEDLRKRARTWCDGSPAWAGSVRRGWRTPAAANAAATRYLYLYLQRRQHVHLLILLDKNEQEDLTAEQRMQIRRWVEDLKRDTGEGTWPGKSR